MRVLFLLILSFGFSSAYGEAEQSHEKVPDFQEVYKEAQKISWQKHYIGEIKLFKHYSTKSCIYKHRDMIFIEHYCNPHRQYRARSFEILSPSLGQMSFYEDDGIGKDKRSITFRFKEDIRLDFPKDLSSLSKEDINHLLEKKYKRYLGSCYVSLQTIPDPEEHKFCRRTEEEVQRDWLDEAWILVNDKAKWDQTYEDFMRLLP